jgi:soluble lytic murein transglycosylase-like protein
VSGLRRGLLAGLLFALAACTRDAAPPPRPSRAEIWSAIQPLAARYRIEPTLVYALVAAESDFEPQARNGDACGLLQLKPAAWRAVSRERFEPGVWDWRKNLETGIDYLAFLRGALHREPDVEFSDPLLLAAFHYGLDYVARRNFDLARVPIPDHEIYRRLWRGDARPIEPPK